MRINIKIFPMLRDAVGALDGTVEIKGNTVGDIIDINADLAAQMEGFGMVEPLEGAEKKPEPSDDGQGKPQSPSEAGQVSPSNSVTESPKSGEPVPASESSQSTTASEGSQPAKKRRGRPKKNK